MLYGQVKEERWASLYCFGYSSRGSTTIVVVATTIGQHWRLTLNVGLATSRLNEENHHPKYQYNNCFALHVESVLFYMFTIVIYWAADRRTHSLWPFLREEIYLLEKLLLFNIYNETIRTSMMASPSVLKSLGHQSQSPWLPL